MYVSKLALLDIVKLFDTYRWSTNAIARAWIITSESKSEYEISEL